MSAAVFLSYARSVSRAPVDALHAALTTAGIEVFVDHNEIPYGSSIPTPLEKGLLGARLVVVFFEPVYFTRWYCRLEYAVATELFRHNPARAAQHVVLSLPAVAVGAALLAGDFDELPPELRVTNWPTAEQTAVLTELIQQRLQLAAEPIGSILDRFITRSGVSALLKQPASIPQPLTLGPMPVVTPYAMRGSLRQEFVGRSVDLWQLHQALAPALRRSGQAAFTASLKGLGGVGKTQLAAEYFHRYGPRHYTGGLFWLDANADVAAQHHKILRKLGDEALPDLVALREATDEQHVQRHLRERLADRLRGLPAHDPVLMVVDDVPDANATDSGLARGRPPALETWCPAPDAAACLVTSRALVSFAGGGKLQRLTVAVLDRDDAVDLLTRGLAKRSSLHEAEWDEIGDWVGRLPLALALLNRALLPDVEVIRPLELLDLARSGESAIAQLERAHETLAELWADDSLRAVLAVVHLSYVNLTSDGKRAARLFACLSARPIPQLLAGLLGPECANPSVRALLLARSILSPTEERAQNTDATKSGGFPFCGSMHPLVAQAIHAFSDDAVADVRHVLDTLARLWMSDEQTSSPDNWPALNSVIPHTRAVLALAVSTVGPGTSIEGRHSVGLLRALGGLAREQGRLVAARTDLEAAVRLSESLFGADDSDTLLCQSELALTLARFGDAPAARRLHQLVRDARCRLLGPDHPAALVSMGHIASIMASTGEVADAVSLTERVVDGCRRTLGPDHPQTLANTANLAHVLGEYGELERARKLLEATYESLVRVHGIEHPTTLTCRGNLAHILGQQGYWAAARDMLTDVIAVEERVLGTDHPTTLQSRGNLADTLRELGELSAARVMQEDVLAAYIRVLGADHPHSLVARGQLSLTLHALGDRVRARSQIEQVLAAQSHLLGEAHPLTLSTRANVAVMMGSMGDHLGASVMRDELVRVHSSKFGATHPSTLASQSRLAATLRELGRLSEARSLQEQVLITQSRTLGDGHPQTTETRANLAATYFSEERWDEARKLHEIVVETRRRALGPEHPQTLFALANLASTLSSMGDSRGARDLFGELLDAQIRVLGDEHPDTLLSKSNLAVALSYLGDVGGAVSLLTEVVESQERVLGVGHPDSQRSRGNLRYLLRGGHK